jgi:hypothetical protein
MKLNAFPAQLLKGQVQLIKTSVQIRLAKGEGKVLGGKEVLLVSNLRRRGNQRHKTGKNILSVLLFRSTILDLRTDAKIKLNVKLTKICVPVDTEVNIRVL